MEMCSEMSILTMGISETNSSGSIQQRVEIKKFPKGLKYTFIQDFRVSVTCFKSLGETKQNLKYRFLHFG